MHYNKIQNFPTGLGSNLNLFEGPDANEIFYKRRSAHMGFLAPPPMQGGLSVLPLRKISINLIMDIHFEALLDYD